MFKTILLAFDGSEGSRRAVPIAKELAQSDEARVVVVHVGERAVPQPGYVDPVPSEEQIRGEVEKELSAQGIDTEVKITGNAAGGPAVPIAAIANEEDADVIVIGTRGHSAVTGVLVGSVTQRLLSIAHRPVLAVPPAE